MTRASTMWRIDEEDNALFIGLVRTFQPGDLAKVLEELEAVAEEHGFIALTGEVTGNARLRLFKQYGFLLMAQVGEKMTEKGIQPVYKIRRERNHASSS